MKMTPQKQLGRDQAQSSVYGAKATGFVTHIARGLQLQLVASGWGRITLHLLVALKTGHYLWHLQGIAREFTRQ